MANPNRKHLLENQTKYQDIVCVKIQMSAFRCSCLFLLLTWSQDNFHLFELMSLKTLKIKILTKKWKEKKLSDSVTQAYNNQFSFSRLYVLVFFEYDHNDFLKQHDQNGNRWAG